MICGRHDGEYFPTYEGPEHLLAAFFKIDLRKVEDERQAILDWAASKNEQKEKA